MKPRMLSFSRKWRARALPAGPRLEPIVCDEIVKPLTWRSARRGVRVGALLLAIAVFNLADLSLTVTHLSGIGMAEANPVARTVVRAGGVAGLIAFKVGLVGLGLGILFRLRRDARAEICAWVIAIAMGLLIHQWTVYGREMVTAAPAILDSPPSDVWIAPHARPYAG